MSKIAFAACLVGIVLASTTTRLQEQRFDYSKQAQIDGNGNIYVSSDRGKLIWMADTKHCSQVSGTSDQQTLVCMVTEDPGRGNLVPSLRLEIYQKGGYKEIIEPGGPIGEWHFWEGDRQIEVSFVLDGGQVNHALYDIGTARLLGKVTETDESLLPQWAKGAAQIQDETVQTSAELAADRTKWISKVLRQIGKFKPGMQRKDLYEVFTTEGGLSTRTQRTYVYSECRYIKVTVHFKVSKNESIEIQDDPDDIIESISQPYLQWGVYD